MKPDSVIASILLLASAPALYANADAVWLIGGGPDVYESQVQIERNVLWVLRAMDSLPGERRVRVFFTDGQEPTADVHEWTEPAETAAVLQPLARVFDAYWRNGLQYRSHGIPDVAGTTEAGPLADALGTDLSALKPGDRGWLIFAGHGTQGEDRNNRLELWNGTHINVGDLQSLLDQAPPEVRLRFVFAQCYAGAFAKLATPDSDRCGFLAAAADQVSEGCSAAVEKRDYEDYSTYFFAALTGQPRNHSGLNGRPDWDSDGRVTPLEAHFHVLTTAFSADVPRATSEVLLMEWRPGEIPDPLAGVPGDENDYMALALSMLRNNGIDPETGPGKELHRRQVQLQGQWERLEQDQERLRQEIVAHQERLKRDVLRRWPRAAAPYTLGFKRFLAEDLEAAQGFIEDHPDYPELQRRQGLFLEQEDAALRLRRERNQLSKIAHVARLGRLKTALEREGPADLRERYRRLRECESAPF
jgi:hypothetical protein